MLGTCDYSSSLMSPSRARDIQIEDHREPTAVLQFGLSKLSDAQSMPERWLVRYKVAGWHNMATTPDKPKRSLKLICS